MEKHHVQLDVGLSEKRTLCHIINSVFGLNLISSCVYKNSLAVLIYLDHSHLLNLDYFGVAKDV